MPAAPLVHPPQLPAPEPARGMSVAGAESLHEAGQDTHHCAARPSTIFYMYPVPPLQTSHPSYCPTVRGKEEGKLP